MRVAVAFLFSSVKGAEFTSTAEEASKSLSAPAYVEVNPKTTVGLRNGINICFANAPIQALFAHRGFVQTVFDMPIDREKYKVDEGIKNNERLDDMMASNLGLERAFAKMALSDGLRSVDGYPDFGVNLPEAAFPHEDGYFGTGADANDFLMRLFDLASESVKRLFRFEITNYIAEVDDGKGGSFYTHRTADTFAYNLKILCHRYLENTYLQRYTHDVAVAVKSTAIRSNPDILLIAVDRLRPHPARWAPINFEETVALPLIEEIRKPEATYDLFAVVTYVPSGFHYYSMVKYGDQWYQANDGSITPTNWETVKTLSISFVALLYSRHGTQREVALRIPEKLAKVAREELAKPPRPLPERKEKIARAVEGAKPIRRRRRARNNTVNDAIISKNVNLALKNLEVILPTVEGPQGRMADQGEDDVVILKASRPSNEAEAVLEPSILAESKRLEQERQQRLADEVRLAIEEVERMERDESQRFKRLQNEKLERELLEKLEKERLERERQERERLDKEQREKERLERERLERIEKELTEKMRLEKELVERERLKKELAEKERLEKEQREKEHLEKHRLEKERLEREALEKERQEKEKHERAERERLEKESLEKERLEKERLEKECVDNERLEKERLDKERLEKERRERGLLENAERERLEQVKRQEEQSKREEEERVQRELLEQKEREEKQAKELLEIAKEKERLETERKEKEALDKIGKDEGKEGKNTNNVEGKDKQDVDIKETNEVENKDPNKNDTDVKPPAIPPQVPNPPPPTVSDPPTGNSSPGSTSPSSSSSSSSSPAPASPEPAPSPSPPPSNDGQSTASEIPNVSLLIPIYLILFLL